MEDTIEQLLQLSKDITPREITPISTNFYEKPKEINTSKWRHPLPSDYLSVPQFIYDILEEQIYNDEQLAIALQNQFINESKYGYRENPPPANRSNNVNVRRDDPISYVASSSSTYPGGLVQSPNKESDGLKHPVGIGNTENRPGVRIDTGEGFFTRISKLGGDMKDRIRSAFKNTRSNYVYKDHKKYKSIPVDNTDDDEVVWDDGRKGILYFILETEMTTFSKQKAEKQSLIPK